MTVDRAVLAFAGSMILLSIALTVWADRLRGPQHAAVGLHGFCPAAAVFRRLGVRPGCAF